MRDRAGLRANCAACAAIVGRLGLVPLGAVGLSNLVHFFATVFFSFLLVVTTPRVADALAVSDTPKARPGFCQGFACHVVQKGLSGDQVCWTHATVACLGVQKGLSADLGCSSHATDRICMVLQKDCLSVASAKRGCHPRSVNMCKAGDQSAVPAAPNTMADACPRIMCRPPSPLRTT